MVYAPKLKEAHYVLCAAVPCFLSMEHGNQLSVLECENCNPWQDVDYASLFSLPLAQHRRHILPAVVATANSVKEDRKILNAVSQKLKQDCSQTTTSSQDVIVLMEAVEAQESGPTETTSEFMNEKKNAD